MARPERIVDIHAHTGEGPIWHPDKRRLYWVDIPAGRLYGYDPAAGDYELVYETSGRPLGGTTVEADGALLLFTHGTVLRFEPTTTAVTTVAELETETRFNDVITDPEGRVFCGTMPGENELGDLYRLDPDGTTTVVVENVDIANGMGFAPDGETFYFTESEAQQIYAFDYDRATGELSNRRILLETPPDDGIPDGMTVDEDGYIWSARWNGGCVVKYAPDGTAVDELDLPARKVSSVTLGGPSYDELYLTTALTDGERATEGDGAGALFRVPDIDTGGVPEFRSRIASE
ncbi:SMP-30/gluconolactonase/LRE family protein [Natrialba taiwanensis]|uniref:SMP-30/gluconolaconase/LRE-like region-containing protein n=1 Tax=Natrialba taiwanensis DSM 12281 TaxID=1230458 RepID=M0AD94_9EURY|nr:SMP-30/gluconolactonase/LRE family protein [Natrialba taiwanensis]ELY96366.1 SMP-30/gluconolaconase/LRE-like region-containing protein [Natrialba taiwanensis DSM 12281]